MYREKYAQKRALQLYREERASEVEHMLLEEGATPDQVATLAGKYHKMHGLFLQEDARQHLKSAQMLLTIGGVAGACGAALTVLSYVALSGVSYLLYYGLMGGGAGLLLKGVLEKKAATAKLHQLRQA